MTAKEYFKNSLKQQSAEDLELDYPKLFKAIIETMESYHQSKMREANEFIIDIAKLLEIDTDGIGHDGLTLSIEDFEEAVKLTRKDNK